ncbi:hypothetical protein BOTBODRAFT_78477, partial [Botryobasidium botryosum FD-172 SS1]
PHHPHCLAKDRLRLWRPLNARNILDEHGRPINLSPEDLFIIEKLMSGAWTEATSESYGSGLLNWHVFCDQKNIIEEHRAPAPLVLITSFIATLAGTYSGKTISNYVSAIRAWHILHGIAWNPEKAELDAALKAADALTPPSSKRQKREPYTVEFITAIKDQLDLNSSVNAAVFACLTMAFYGVVRVGEFTVPKLKDFDPAIHVKPSNMWTETDSNGFSTTTMFVPHTKSAPQGEDVYWARQEGLSDPVAAWDNHVHVNAPPQEGHLFAYR